MQGLNVMTTYPLAERAGKLLVKKVSIAHVYHVFGLSVGVTWVYELVIIDPLFHRLYLFFFIFFYRLFRSLYFDIFFFALF